MTQPAGLEAPAATPLPMEGVKVIDAAALGAGPWLATRLADWGADVIKVEQPTVLDPLRQLGSSKDGVPLWWKSDGRNKRCITLDLRRTAGQEIFKRLAADADVVIESFRPGTMERWNLGYETLSADNPGLVMVRVSGWGQDGPYRNRPGFGTLAEAISGWAHLNGFPENPPTLPPMALADAVTALTGAFATLTALYWRDARGGEGQVIDISIYESLFSLIGSQVMLYDRLGVVPTRTGNAVDFAAPRNVYETADGRYVALAASTQVIFERVARAVERPDLIDDPRYLDNAVRVEHSDELDAIIGDWIRARPLHEVIDVFERHEAAIAPVYDIAQIFEDPHFRAREAIVTVDDPDLGPTRTCNVFPRFSKTQGSVRHLGMHSGSHTDEVLASVGYTREQIQELRAEQVI